MFNDLKEDSKRKQNSLKKSTLRLKLILICAHQSSLDGLLWVVDGSWGWAAISATLKIRRVWHQLFVFQRKWILKALSTSNFPNSLCLLRLHQMKPQTPIPIHYKDWEKYFLTRGEYSNLFMPSKKGPGIYYIINSHTCCSDNRYGSSAYSGDMQVMSQLFETKEPFYWL